MGLMLSRSDLSWIWVSVCARTSIATTFSRHSSSTPASLLQYLYARWIPHNCLQFRRAGPFLPSGTHRYTAMDYGFATRAVNADFQDGKFNDKGMANEKGQAYLLTMLEMYHEDVQSAEKRFIQLAIRVRFHNEKIFFRSSTFLW